jgi:hypothetical protein
LRKEGVQCVNVTQCCPNAATDASDDEPEEPEDVKRAWEELMMIQREQQRWGGREGGPEQWQRWPE